MPGDWRRSIYYHYYEGENSLHSVYKHYGLRTDRYKLVYFYTLDEWEFYDLIKDTQEMQSEYTNTTYANIILELKVQLNETRQHYEVPEST